MMEDFELLDKLTTAYKENNKDEFTRLCCSDCQNGSDYNNFHSLYVLRSHITENNDTFIEHLTRYITDEERPLLEQFTKTNYHYDFEYYDIDEDNVETARDLYNKYEEELDVELIWDNAQKIIDDFSKKLTEIEQYQFALKKLEAADTDEEILLACDDDNNSYGYYPLNYEWCDGGIWIDGIDYAIYIQHEELSQIDEETANDEDASAQLAAYYLSCNVNEIIEQVKIKIEQLKDKQELENDENNEEEFDVNARHDDWDFFEAV